MAITALPPSTIQLLGSAQVLTTPTSLIKELIDNSLDAKATAIDILISPNTLDLIEVRDNGHGISLEDLEVLGKRGYTSKLRSFEELRFLGGATLGFRGEALASAVQLGNVTVTTKTDGETVATLVSLSTTGGVEHQKKSSHPVGTTVAVFNFMAKLPVRKKTFEKEATKTIANVHKLLYSYALARPSTRFNLKVTKGAKGSWSFAPRSSDGIKEAVSTIIGRDVASQCSEAKLTSSPFITSPRNSINADDVHNGQTASGYAQPDFFRFEAFLPKPGTEHSLVGNGQYISIDSRPVSHEKGTAKKIVAMFRKYIRNSLSAASEKIKSPFIRLNIQCARASYDPNVEPAKDNVIFGDEKLVLDSMEQLLRNFYGELEDVHIISSRPKDSSQNDFELLLSRTARIPIRSENPVSDESRFIDGYATAVPCPGIGGETVHYSFPSPTTNLELIEHEQVEIDQTRNSPKPWTTAKMSIPTSQDPKPTSLCADPRSDVVLLSPAAFDIFQEITEDNLVAKSRSLNQSLLPNDVQASQISQSEDSFQSPAHHVTRVPWTSRPREIDGPESVKRALPAQMLLSPPATLLSKGARLSRGPNNPFVPPRRVATNSAGGDGFIQTKLSGHSHHDHGVPSQSENPSGRPSDLDWAMDFEHRKEEAILRRKEEKRAARAEHHHEALSITRPSPHENRSKAAIANLEPSQAPCSLRPTVSENPKRDKDPLKTSLADDDPRAYLMRRQESALAQSIHHGASTKKLRAKSTKLPLEGAYLDENLCKLVQVQRSKRSQDIRTFTESLNQVDGYVGSRDQASGFVMPHSEALELTERVQDIVRLWNADGSAKDSEILFDFTNLLEKVAREP